MKILVVCLGNYCRSPLGEAILRHKAQQRQLPVNISSAGTWHFMVGSPPHELSQRVARERGLDISMQRARQITRDDFKEYDLILAMAGDVLEELRQNSASMAHSGKLRLFLDELYPGENRDVPDPMGLPEQAFQEVYEMIDSGSEAIIQSLQKLQTKHG